MILDVADRTVRRRIEQMGQAASGLRAVTGIDAALAFAGQSTPLP